MCSTFRGNASKSSYGRSLPDPGGADDIWVYKMGLGVVERFLLNTLESRYVYRDNPLPVRSEVPEIGCPQPVEGNDGEGKMA